MPYANTNECPPFFPIEFDGKNVEEALDSFDSRSPWTTLTLRDRARPWSNFKVK